MNCKNCKANLRTDFKYCPVCGAKIVFKRITFRGLFTDIFERILNLENNFFRTIGHLTVWPEKVISGYMDGTRRRYLNPINYLTLSLALSGVLFYFMKRFALDKMDFDVLGMGVNQEGSAKLMEATMEYSNFVFILYIPVIAIAGFLSLNKKNYNIPEYIVAATYTLAHYSILTFPISLIMLWLNPEGYLAFSFWFLAIMVGYILYALIRTHPYSAGKIVLRSILFITLFLVGYLVVSVVMPIIFLITGDITVQDLLPSSTP